MVEINDGGLSDETLPNLCRLCLQVDDFIVNIFHRLDPNPNKKPLPERIYDLYQIKVRKSDGLPTNICHRCLYFTESFSEFRDNVRQCEVRLQKYIASIGILGSVKPQTQNLSEFGDGIKQEKADNSYGCVENYSDFMPDDNNMVTIVDPNQDYESSTEDFSLDSDEEYSVHQAKTAIMNATPSQDTVDDNSNNVISNNGTNDFSLFHHDDTDHNDSLTLKNVFLCQYCDMAFTSRIECAEHESRHDAANPYSCNYCPFRCSCRQTVITHIKEMHDNERPFVCVQCDKTFGRRSDLKKHTTVHTGIRPFTCPVCGKNFSRNTNLTKHLRIHTSLRPFVCQKCPRSFTTSEDLRRHERVHNNQKMFQCSHCPSSFTKKEKLIHHEAIHGRKANSKSVNVKSKKTKTAINKLTLQQQCQQVEKQMFQQQLQKFSHTENMIISLNPFTDINQMSNMEGLQQDTVFKKPVKSMQTTLANKSSKIKKTKSSKQKQEQQQQQEQEQQEQQQQQQQQQQDKQCAQNSSITEPKRKRELRRNFICPVCFKAFLRRRELQRHSFIHTGMKPFPCQYCPKRFSRKDKATRHEKSHFEDKFPCSHCQMMFSKQEALEAHLKFHELDKIISPTTVSVHHQQMQQQQQQQNQQLPLPNLHFGGNGQPIEFQSQQQHHHGMMQSTQQMQHIPMYHSSTYHPGSYRPPQLNFYSEIQPEN